MADVKRNAAAGKNVTTKSGGQAMNELDAALSKAVGARIRITTTLPSHTLEGTLFTACTLTNLIALNITSAPPNPSSTLSNQPADYHIVPVSHIQSFQLLSLPPTNGSGGFEAAVPGIHRVDTEALRQREAAAVRKLKEKEAMRGRGVGREAQEMFDALAKIYPARWDNSTIIVNDAVMIDKPYTPEACRAPKDAVSQQTLVMVKKMLQGHAARKQAAQGQGQGRPGVATPMAPRKGG
ncbi:hypothetical protein H2201_005030 [Coniosporium apollinis]|uniref:AD domain-containing protein n=1 Tax=Coniosporium apollinis TaxID=61459 RepID=A0ABQ9NQU5_9PEZI|nr:hypothetical protein H2201_005030 [Coniosporium apollinis]